MNSKIIKHGNGANEIQLSIEGDNIRFDCFIAGEQVYGGLHPATVIANVLEGDPR